MAQATLNKSQHPHPASYNTSTYSYKTPNECPPNPPINNYQPLAILSNALNLEPSSMTIINLNSAVKFFCWFPQSPCNLWTPQQSQNASHT